MEYVNMFFRGMIQILAWVLLTIVMVGLIVLFALCLILLIDVVLDSIKSSALFGPLYKKTKKTVTKKGIKLYEKLDTPSHKEEL